MKNIQNHLLEDISCLKSEMCKLYTQVLTIVYINLALRGYLTVTDFTGQ